MEGIKVEARASQAYVRKHNRKQNLGVGCLQTTHMKLKHTEKFRQGSRRCAKQIQTKRNQWDSYVSSWRMSLQFSSVAQSCPTLCDPMNRSTPGLPVHHQLPEFTQIHIHRVHDAIQPSHPLSFPSPPAPNPSQHQSLFQ